jgi:L-2-hydroxyglutarate oxidase LhgO
VLEKNARPGLETSSRNSGVIHAGIYYPSDSLKTRLCIQGRALLYRYCQQHQIPHQRCGKLIVATNTREESALRTLQQQACANGVILHWWDQARTQHEEPALHASAALFSADSGIIDTAAYTLQLAADVQRHGADIVTHCSAERIIPCVDGFEITTRSSDVEHTVRVKKLVNAAGLQAQTLAQNTSGLDALHMPPLYRCKGDYFRYAKATPFAHLIYPVIDKNAPGLGIHATLDLQGSLRFGPDVEYTETTSFVVNENKRALFCNAIQRYFPALD